MPSWMVGIDTGGTFTDLIAYEVHSREIRVGKISSTPEDPSTAVIAVLKDLLVNTFEPSGLKTLVHGTTVATNAILEGKGSKTALFINEGFRAVYEARGWAQPRNKTDLIDPFYQKPPMLVPQHLTYGIPGRLDYTGVELTPLDETAVRKAGLKIKNQEIEAIAICYLFSFKNAKHEERTAEILREISDQWRISLSSQILPTIREYPRQSTTVIDAYIGPPIQKYLETLFTKLDHIGIKTPQKFLMQSNGGLMRMNVGARFPNQTLLSGPAGAVVAGMELAKLTNFQEMVTLDMGGTSTDISIISNGQVTEVNEGQIAEQDIGTPMLEVRTLGAGGGTIATIGPDGLLKVGPESAGANPGPACYGLGGVNPTVTDANLVLGTLDKSNVLGGRMSLDKKSAEKSIKNKIAVPLEISLTEAAAGILRIVITNMAVELRLALLSRGEDARKFSLGAFGGAGPLHATLLAHELGIPTVIVPVYPGINSALGLLQPTVRHVYLQSSVSRLSETSMDEMIKLFGNLEKRAEADLREEEFDTNKVKFLRQIDMRYQHQGYQIPVGCPTPETQKNFKNQLKSSFDKAHQRIYGSSAPNEDAELVTYRVIVEVTVPKLELPKLKKGGNAEEALIGSRKFYDLEAKTLVDASIYQRDKLSSGNTFKGPCIIQQFDSTTVVLSGMKCTVDNFGNIIIQIRKNV